MIYKGNTEISPAPYRDAAGKEILLIQTSGALTHYEIPAGATSIKPYCFYMYNNLQSVYLPSTVTEIFGHAFEMATALEEINFPVGLTKIQNDAFRQCVNITNVNLPSTLLEIGSNAFYGCVALESVNLPSSLIRLDIGAFQDCRSLTSVTIPSSITGIKEKLFEGCSSLKTVNIQQGENITEIGDRAFYNCTSLETVNIPAGVTKLKTSCFYGCSSLENIVIPDAVTEIGKYAFQKSGLKSISFSNNTLCDINSSAFQGCNSLQSVTIPRKVQLYGLTVFADCLNLETVDFYPQVVQSQCFNGCLKLKNVTLHDVLYIKGNAFERTCIEYLEIPDTMVEISDNAFKSINVENSTHIVFKGNIPSIGGNWQPTFSFTGNGVVNFTIKGTGSPSTNGGISTARKFGHPANNEIHIYVPASLVDAYKSASNWVLYWDCIEADPETV